MLLQILMQEGRADGLNRQITRGYAGDYTRFPNEQLCLRWIVKPYSTSRAAHLPWVAQNLMCTGGVNYRLLF